MKKYIFFIILLFIPIFINAQTCDIEKITIENIEVDKINGEVSEKSSPVIDGVNISLDLKMTEVGDYIRYKITIKNDSADNFEFSKKNLTTNSDYFSYTFDNNDNVLIGAHKSADIYLTIKYKARVASSSFDNGIFNELKDVKTSLNVETLVNPNTGVFEIRIVIYIMLAISLLLYFVSSSKKFNKEYYSVLLFLSILLPISVYSACMCEVKVNSKIEIEEFTNRNIYNISGDESMLDSVKSKFVTPSSGIDFTRPSSDTNGKGIYIFDSTKNDKYPVYYYRGNISNNNVLFGDFCWKILRTTSTGGTKLVYNGVPDSEGKCNSTGVDTQIGTGIKYGLSANLGYFGYSYTVGHAYKNVKISAIPDGSVFAEDVTYENGKYILNDNRYIKDSSLSSDTDAKLKDHHYSCFKNENGECTTVNYVYMLRGVYLYYIVLSGGENIDDVLSKDLYNSTNENNSNIKTYLENWYANNLVSYNDYIEDEVYCNDRTIGDKGAWGIHGSLEDKLLFSSFTRADEGKPSIKCSNKNDSFTISSEIGNGKNNYPIGLITLDEGLMAGFSWNADDKTNYLYNERVWWTMSPTLVSVQLDYIGVLHSMADNVTTVYISGTCGGVRPVITLKNIAKIKDGNGTIDNPFTIAELN